MEYEELEEEVYTPSKTLANSLKYVQDTLGVPLPNGLGEEYKTLSIPANIGDLPDNILIDNMSKWTQVMGYVKVEAAKMDIDRTAKDNAYTMERASRYLQLRSAKTLTEEEIKQTLKADNRLNKLLFNSEFAKAKLTLLDSLFFTAKQNYTLFSRELTKRGISFDADMRETKD